MIRKLALLAPFAVLALAACDGPSALTKAQPGDCFAVTGRQSNGEPKWEKTPCAYPAATTVATATPVDKASPAAPAAPVAAGPACPTAKPVSCPPVTRTSSRAARSSARHADRRTVKAHKSRSSRHDHSREFARVPQDDALLGGPTSGDHYSYRSAPYPGMPPLPPQHRYYEREYERYQGEGHAVPPPPPPPQDNRGSEQSAISGSREEGYSYSEESFSSSSRSSASHERRGPCCDGQRSRTAPMNGPHFPVDGDGFLTWRGKTSDE